MFHRPHHLEPRKETARVIFSAKNFGSCEGISNIGLGVTNLNTVKVLRGLGYYAEVWSAQDAVQIDKQIQASVDKNEHPVTHFIINSPSWITAAQIEKLALKWRNIVFVLQNHTGCAYLQIDRNADETGIMCNRKVIDLERAMTNVKISGNNVRFVNWLQRTYKAPCLFLPNLYDVSSFVDPYPRNRDFGGTIRIGSFGAPRGWKNQLTAAMGAVELTRQLGVNLEFYVNSKRSPDKHLDNSRRDLFASSKDLKLIEIGWESWTEFKRTVAHMHLLVQPSFDETFNVVTADGIAAGVPTVTSESIEWSPEDWWCKTCDPSSICKTGLYLLNAPYAIEDARRLLKDYVKVGVEYWRDFIGR